MEEKLVTLAILTFSKAQILKGVLENEGIEAYIHNVNQIQPVVSSGVRLRIRESDLPRALKITESSSWLSESVVEEVTVAEEKGKSILIPVDFSDYSMKACELGFSLAREINATIDLLHVYFTPMYASPLPYGDVFSYQIAEDDNVRDMFRKADEDVKALSEKLKAKIAAGELPAVEFTVNLRDGIPEDEILKYSKEHRPKLIIMGTRGKNKKDVDLIGSVSAEVIDRSKTPVLVIPEDTSSVDFAEIKQVAFVTNFDQRDLISFDSFIRGIKNIPCCISLIYLADNKGKDAWDEVKLAGIKEYFQKQYPTLKMQYDQVADDNLLSELDKYIKTHNISFIVIPTYKRNIFSRLFNPGIARRMIFHSDTPLFVIK